MCHKTKRSIASATPSSSLVATITSAAVFTCHHPSLSIGCGHSTISHWLGANICSNFAPPQHGDHSSLRPGVLSTEQHDQVIMCIPHHKPLGSPLPTYKCCRLLSLSSHTTKLQWAVQSTHLGHSIAHGDAEADVCNNLQVIAAIADGHNGFCRQRQVRQQRLQAHPFVNPLRHQLQHRGHCLHHLRALALQRRLQVRACAVTCPSAGLEYHAQMTCITSAPSLALERRLQVRPCAAACSPDVYLSAHCCRLSMHHSHPSPLCNEASAPVQLAHEFKVEDVKVDADITGASVHRPMDRP